MVHNITLLLDQAAPPLLPPPPPPPQESAVDDAGEDAIKGRGGREESDNFNLLVAPTRL